MSRTIPPEPNVSEAGASPTPRYEFRVFAADLSEPRDALARKGEAEPPEGRSDTYLVVRDRYEIGLKLRGAGERLELKRLIGVQGRCELWQPATSADLPLKGSDIARAFLAPAGLRDELDPSAIYDRRHLLKALEGRDALRLVSLEKHRRKFRLGPDEGEWVEILFPDGQREESVAVESEDHTRLAALITGLGLGGRQNVSLPRRLIAYAFARR